MSDAVLELPTALRSELKDPLGPVYTDAEALLAEAADPIVSVGDVVTYHLLEAGRVPAVAFVDDRTERAAVDPAVSEAIAGFDRELALANPPATVAEPLLHALLDALASDGTTLIRVDGEEDLAALPAVLAVPDGGSVVYGQPGEGMVLVRCDDRARATVRDLIERMDGDPEGVLALLDAERP